MQDIRPQTHKGWTIRVEPADAACSHFAMTILDHDGMPVHKVAQAGLTAERAFERGREMVDIEEELRAG